MARTRGSRGLEFFCCAIPLINVGAYVTVTEIAIAASLVGVLALAPSYSIVAGLDVIPSWSKAIVSALGFLTCLWQIVGIISIRKEATKLYHAYARITTLLTLVVIAVTIAFEVLAATSHDKAQSACNSVYGALPSTTSSGVSSSSIVQNYGNDICNYFIWAQVGAMGGLILLLALTQLYMCFALRAYGVAQRRATRDYKKFGGGALYESTPDDSYPLAARHSAGRGDSPVWEEPHQNHYNATGREGRGQYGDDAAINRYPPYDEGQDASQYSSGIAASRGEHQPGYGAPAGYPTGSGSYSGYPAPGAPATGGYESYPAR